MQNREVNHHAGLNYLPFITDKKLDKVIGFTDFRSQKVARRHYNIKAYPFFIEIYLGPSAIGRYIMTAILQPVIDNFLSQAVPSICAVVNRFNIAARKVLEKAQFY